MDKDELRLESELDELRLKIAKAKGWKFGGIDNREETNYWVKDPEGYFVVTYCDIPEEAWNEAKEEYIPNWPNYIAEAFELVEEAQAQPHEQAFELIYAPAVMTRWCARIGCHGARGETPAEAISRAYLSWKEAVQQEAR